jgi:hypothetical protein
LNHTGSVVARLVEQVAPSTKALVLAVVCVILCPILIYIEMIAFVGVAFITYEPGNPILVKAAAVVVLVLIAAVALALPVIALVMGGRARNGNRASETVVVGASRARAAQIIAGVVLAGVALVQIYFVLWGAGVCSLDGC